MPRFRLDIEYDGSLYAGWQRQAGQPSVQQEIEQAIEKFCGEQVSLRGAGRTDAGVHATAQVAHVDLVRAWPSDKVRETRWCNIGFGASRSSGIMSGRSGSRSSPSIGFIMGSTTLPRRKSPTATLSAVRSPLTAQPGETAPSVE